MLNKTYQSIKLFDKASKVSELWSPKVIAEMNDYQFKVAKLKGEFVWHKHDDTDEAFIVIEGELKIDFRDGHVRLKQNEMFIVPKGKEHKPLAENECTVLLIEPKGVINTGDTESPLTAENDIWV